MRGQRRTSGRCPCNYHRPAVLTELQRGIHDRSGWLRGCQCPRCHADLLRYGRERLAAASLRRGSEPSTRIDSTRVRRHLERLQAEGWTLSAIVRKAGVNRGTVDRTAHGYLKHCSRITARLVLAVDGPPP